MNTKIYIAPSRRKSSEALAAEQMSFKFFFANVSVDSEEVRRMTGRLFQVAGPDTAKSRRPAYRTENLWILTNTGHRIYIWLFGDQSMGGMKS